MLRLSDKAPSENAKAILDAASPHLHFQDRSIKLYKSWVYQNRIAVFDFLINGNRFAFDVIPGTGGAIRIEVFGRRRSVNTVLSKTAFAPLQNDRFLVSEFFLNPNERNSENRVCLTVAQAAEQLARLTHRPSDLVLLECIGSIQPLIIVDVGANAITEPPYSPLRQFDLCKIVGFEPQQQAFDELQRNRSRDELYLPYAVGAPGEANLNVYAYSGFSSTFNIDEETIGLIPKWYDQTRLQKTVPMTCTALDDVPGLPQLDLLKIDIQGGELNVFHCARRSLENALCIITEVSFFPLYYGAPNFADVHLELSRQGFFFHKFMSNVRIPIANSYSPILPVSAGASQLLDGDAVYLRDYRDMRSLDTVSIKKYAALGHFVLDSRDYVIRMLAELVLRSEIKKELLERYISSIS